MEPSRKVSRRSADHDVCSRLGPGDAGAAEGQRGGEKSPSPDSFMDDSSTDGYGGWDHAAWDGRYSGDDDDDNTYPCTLPIVDMGAGAPSGTLPVVDPDAVMGDGAVAGAAGVDPDAELEDDAADTGDAADMGDAVDKGADMGSAADVESALVRAGRAETGGPLLLAHPIAPPRRIGGGTGRREEEEDEEEEREG